MISQRSFTWEGRCYDGKFKDRDVLNVYLVSVGEHLESVVEELKSVLGETILLTEEITFDDDPAWPPVVYFCTIVIDEDDSDHVFAQLHVKGFQER